MEAILHDLSRMLEGTPSWLEETYDLYGQASYSLAARILGAGEDAERAIVEAFQELWRLRQRAQHVDVRVLLLLITRNSAVTRLRRLKRLEAPQTLPLHLAPAVGLTRETQSIADPAKALEALAALEPTPRLVLERTFFEGYTLAETAAELGVTNTDVRNALASAMTALANVVRQGDRRDSTPMNQRPDSEGHVGADSGGCQPLTMESRNPWAPS